MSKIIGAIDRIPQPIKNIIPKKIKKFIYSVIKSYHIKRDSLSGEKVNKKLNFGDHQWEMTLPADQSPWWRDYIKNNCHEPKNTEILISELNRSSVFWDIGSKYGYFAMVASSILDESGEIHIFEPLDERIKWNKKNVDRINPSTRVNGYPLGTSDDGNSTGDEYYAQGRCPDVVKIDVDGHEKSVLDGMESVLSDCKPALLIEIHFDEIEGMDDYETDIKSIWDILNKYYGDVSVCYDHRNENADWKLVLSLEELPDKSTSLSEENQSPPDFMLYCRN